MNPGDTFLLDQTAIGVHLAIVISNPTDDGTVALVTVTTQRPHHPADCVLVPGDHAFVRHDSVVLYSRARISDVKFLSRYMKPQEPLTPAVLKRVLAGAVANTDLPIAVESLLQDQGLVP